MVDLKTCYKCRESKPHAAFFRNKHKKDGLQNSCKACSAAALAAWAKANPEKARAKTSKWREANPEKARASCAKWREANPEKARASAAKWREANPEKVRAWFQANAEKVKAYSAKFTARDLRRAHRYARAIKYFEGRPSWVALIAACLLRERRLHQMEWMVPSLSYHLATQEI